MYGIAWKTLMIKLCAPDAFGLDKFIEIKQVGTLKSIL